MADDLGDFLAAREPTPDRPLLGLAVLVVEDSRFACEAMRLLCLRSGARIRRADCLRAAHRHLAAYRPAVVVVDLGLPDGSGLDLIAEIAGQRPRVPALLATSGDAGAADRSRAAGADGFLAKPIESLSAFRHAILAALPAGGCPAPPGRAPSGEDRVRPDPIALRDDLSLAADLLGDRPEGATLDYLARFLAGVALAAHDAPLRAAAEELALGRRAARDLGPISALVRSRLAARAPI